MQPEAAPPAEPVEPPSGTAHPKRSSLSLGRDAQIATLSGVIALVTSLVVALISVWNANSNLSRDLLANREAQASEFKERREVEARSKNSAIYQEFLSAADAFYVAGRSVRDCIAPHLGRVSQQESDRWQTRCYQQYGKNLVSLDARLRKATTTLYIYGTDDAWRAQARLTASLETITAYSQDGEDGVIKDDSKVDEEFPPAYANFQKVMCRELSTAPGNRCDEAPSR